MLRGLAARRSRENDAARKASGETVAPDPDRPDIRYLNEFLEYERELKRCDDT